MKIFVISTFLFLTFTANAEAATYYVAPTGNDSNPGTISSPWATIRKATQTLVAGDTVLVRGGTYNVPNNDANNRPNQTLNSGNPTQGFISYKAYPGETPVIQGSYPIPGNLTFAGIDILGDSYIHIEGFTITGFMAGLSCKAPGHNIVFKNNILKFNSVSGISITNKVSGTTEACDYVTIEGNEIYNNGYYSSGLPSTGNGEGWGSGISINAHGVPFTFDTDDTKFHSIVRGNKIYHNYDGTGGDIDTAADHTDGNGIIFDMAGNIPPVLVENNIIYDNGGRGIHSLGGSNIWIIGNTLYKNNTDPLFQSSLKGEIIARPATLGIDGVDLPVTNIHIFNNVIEPLTNQYSNYFLTGVDLQNMDIQNNLWFGGIWDASRSKIGSNALTSDPLFLNPSLFDFHLTSASPAINSGTSSFILPGAQLFDFDNNPRPKDIAYDIGAFEGTAGYSIYDLSYLISKFGQNDSLADLDGSGKVNVIDLSILLSNFGQ